MTHKETIAFVMKIFDEEYHGKFINSKDRMKIWSQMLSGYDSDTILAAAYHLASTRKDWAPDIATMREQCVLMYHGELQQPTGAESWELVMGKVGHEDVELDDMQKQALKQTGLTILDLRTVNVSNIPTIRSQYCKAFDSLVNKRHQDRVTLPEVKALASKNCPALPAPDTKVLPVSEDVMSAEEALADPELGPQMKNLQEMWGAIGDDPERKTQ